MCIFLSSLLTIYFILLSYTNFTENTHFKNAFILVVNDISGNNILTQDVSNYWNKPLRIWKYQKEILAHLHITKSSGSSFRATLRASNLSNGCKIQCVGKKINKLKEITKKCPGKLPSLCGRHFDWSLIDKVEKKGYQVAPLLILRHPVSRVISEYYFTQHTEKNTGHIFLNQNISEFLSDFNSMMESNHIWHDGLVSVIVSIFPDIFK